MRIQGILFDKDGTLINFQKVWLPATVAVVHELMREYGVQENQDNIDTIYNCLGVINGEIDSRGALAYKSYSEIAVDLEPVIGLISNQIVRRDELAEFLRIHYDQKVNENREEYPTFTDVVLLFRKLVKRKIQLGVVTTDDKEPTLSCLRTLRIDSYLSFLGTANTNMPIKPDKKLLTCAAEKWKIPSTCIAVVGDTPNDIKFAKNAGAIAIGVLSGTGKKEDLSEADYVITSIDELMNLLVKDELI